MLLVQHVGGRVLTQFILANANPPGAWPAPLPGPGWRPRHHLRVYQPHEAREDTVVFPSSAGSSAPGNSLTSDGTSPTWSVSSSAGTSSARWCPGSRAFADLERQQFGGGRVQRDGAPGRGQRQAGPRGAGSQGTGPDQLGQAAPADILTSRVRTGRRTPGAYASRRRPILAVTARPWQIQAGTRGSQPASRLPLRRQREMSRGPGRRIPTARPECKLACRSSLCRIEGNLAAVGHEYMVSKHRGGHVPPARSGSPEGKGSR